MDDKTAARVVARHFILVCARGIRLFRPFDDPALSDAIS